VKLRGLLKQLDKFLVKAELRRDDSGISATRRM
jgi:hypothetical protein